MDQQTPIDESLIQHEFILPEDVSMIAICDLDEATRLRLAAFDEDTALSRRHVRATTQVIDQELSRLLNQFRHPCSIVQAIARQCKDDPQQAESILEEVPADLRGHDPALNPRREESARRRAVEWHSDAWPGLQWL